LLAVVVVAEVESPVRELVAVELVVIALLFPGNLPVVGMVRNLL
jgi:hypothetical protein